MMNRGVRRELSLFTGAAALGLWARRDRGLALAIGLGTLALRFWPGTYSFRNRAVIITGGSRGLGLALAENFLKAGARVALLARDSDELDRAQALLAERASGEVITLECDVTRPDELRRAFDQAEGVFGQIDILVNNAGSIAIGPFEAMNREDFEALLAVQVHAVVDAVQMILPQFRSQGGGRIVNICSIGGKIAVPHMSTYCAAKFALAGLSSALSAELARDNIDVTTVFPGLMRTGSPIQAAVKGEHEKEFAWFALGDATPVISVSADRAARKIMAGIRDGDAEVVFPTTARLAALARGVFPELFALTMRTAARFFPDMGSTERKTGTDSRGLLEQLPGYEIFRPAMEEVEDEYNQEPTSDADHNLGV